MTRSLNQFPSQCLSYIRLALKLQESVLYMLFNIQMTIIAFHNENQKVVIEITFCFRFISFEFYYEYQNCT